MVEKLRLKKKFTVLTFAALVFGGQFAALGTQAHAANTANFRAGNIISDSTFTNKNAMSAAAIQNFLNSKNSVCLKNFQTLSLHDANKDGYGDEPYGRGVNSKVSAATLIWQAAQIYNLNPQVILVTLQKEQGLITRSDCPSWRYNTALGYGCPDSAPCNTAAYGFTRQIDYGAWHFRGFFDDSMSFVPYTPGNRTVAWHPDVARCGSSTFTIENRATAALYSYTTYRPNQAALNAGYGLSGDSCSSYGNRNFWLFFTDWFKQTAYTPFFSNGNKVYIEGANNTYYYVPSQSMMEAYGFKRFYHTIQPMGSSQLAAKTFAGNLPSHARFEGDEIYFMSYGRRHHVPNVATLNAYGYSVGNEAKLSKNTKPSLPEIAKKVSTVFTVESNSAIYVAENGKKRHIGNPEAYSTLGSPTYDQRPISNYSKAFAATTPAGAPVLKDGTIIKNQSTNRLGVLQNNTVRYASSAEVSRDWKFSAGYQTNQATLNHFSTATTIGRYVTSATSGNLYLLDNGKKFQVSNAEALALQLGSPATVTNSFLERLPTVQYAGTFRINNSSKIYTVKNGELYHIFNREAFDKLGFNWNSIVSITSGMGATLDNNGKLLLRDGQPLRIGNSPSVYFVDNQNTRRPIPSRQLFDAYGFSMNSVLSVSQTSVAHYVPSSNATNLIKDSADTHWLIDNGRRQKISSSLMTAYGLQPASAITLSAATISSIAAGPDLTNLVQAKGKDTVYRIENGHKRPFSSRQSFEANGGNWNLIRQLSQAFVNSLPTGSPF